VHPEADEQAAAVNGMVRGDAGAKPEFAGGVVLQTA